MAKIWQLWWKIIPIYAALLLLLGIGVEKTAVLQAQDSHITATPDAEGVIYELVRPNDTLSAIAFRTGTTLETLLQLNNLSDTDFIQPGQLLIIGRVTPAATDTPIPTMTATLMPPVPTNTIMRPRTALCLTAFIDTDRNGLFDAGESLKTAVAFTIFTEEAVVGNFLTDGVTRSYCLEELPADDYLITRSVGPNEQLTTAGEMAVAVTEGAVVELAFGSYIGETTATATTAVATSRPVGDGQSQTAVVQETAVPAPPPSSSPRNLLLLAVGTLAIAVIIGSGLFLWSRKAG